MARDFPPSSTHRTASAPSLRDALADLAASERTARAAPTAEELLALAAGTLDAARREELLDQLADDPELADVYLELRRAAAAEAAIEPAPAQDNTLDAAWRDFETRRRYARWPVLAAAALLVVAAGLALLARKDPAHTGADDPRIASYHRLDAPADVRRDPRVTVPADTPGLVLAVGRRQLAAAGVLPVDRPPNEPTDDLDALEIALFDASDHPLAVLAARWSPPDDALLVAVAAEALPWGRTVRLVVRSDGGTFTWILTPTAASGHTP